MSDNDLPEPGSHWKARDGRVLRVVIVGAPVLTAFWRRTPITCAVLNATGRTRGTTTIDAANFGPGRFLERTAAPSEDAQP